MIKRLKSPLLARTLSPLFKIAIFAALFWWLAQSRSLVAFIAYAAWGGVLHGTLFHYKSHSPFFLSFLSLYVFGCVAALTLPANVPAAVAGFVLAALLFVLWGVYVPVFSRYRFYASLVYYSFFFLVVAWASAQIFTGGWWLIPFVWIELYVITKEYVSLFLEGWNRRAAAFVLVASLLVLEEMFVASLLSFGSLAVASLAIISILTALDGYAHAVRGVLTRDLLYKDAIIFIGLSAAVLAAQMALG